MLFSNTLREVVPIRSTSGNANQAILIRILRHRPSETSLFYMQCLSISIFVYNMFIDVYRCFKVFHRCSHRALTIFINIRLFPKGRLILGRGTVDLGRRTVDCKKYHRKTMKNQWKTMKNYEEQWKTNEKLWKSEEIDELGTVDLHIINPINRLKKQSGPIDLLYQKKHHHASLPYEPNGYLKKWIFQTQFCDRKKVIMRSQPSDLARTE